MSLGMQDGIELQEPHYAVSKQGHASVVFDLVIASRVTGSPALKLMRCQIIWGRVKGCRMPFKSGAKTAWRDVTFIFPELEARIMELAREKGWDQRWPEVQWEAKKVEQEEWTEQE